MPSCPCWGGTLTDIYGPHDNDEHRTNGFNISPDREDSDNPIYDWNLIRWTGQVCNLVRGARSIEEGEEGVAAMCDAWRDGDAVYGEDSYMRAVKKPSPPVTPQDKKKLSEKAISEWHDVDRRCEETQKDDYKGDMVKFNKLTVPYLEQTLTARWVEPVYEAYS